MAQAKNTLYFGTYCQLCVLNLVTFECSASLTYANPQTFWKQLLWVWHCTGCWWNTDIPSLVEFKVQWRSKEPTIFKLNFSFWDNCIFTCCCQKQYREILCTLYSVFPKGNTLQNYSTRYWHWYSQDTKFFHHQTDLFSISTILSLQECYILGIIQYTIFWDWLSSLSIIQLGCGLNH